MLNTMVGKVYELTHPMLGMPSGALGYCFNEYDDFDGKGKGIQIIFENGNYDGFSVEEQGLFLKHVGYNRTYACYDFENVMQVSRDFKSGYWEW